MEKISLKELALPLIKSIDSFNYILKSHHRRTAIVAYYLGRKMGLDQKDMLPLVISAAMHDIGALSIQERDMLIKEDVENPEPHCIMGHRMLSNFEVFDKIARIIRHHHVKFSDLQNIKDEVLSQCHIIHLADRVDILICHDKFILSQKKEVIDKILAKKGSVFHPDVCDAFVEVAKADIFWIEINNMSMEQLFNKLDFTLIHDLTREQMIEFSLVVSRIIDFRSKFTASHSYTVGRLACKIGEILGFDEDKCVKLLIAGYLHDIGKIGIDTSYIEKPGPLTDEEFNLVKLHTYYTGQILSELSNSDWFKDIVDWSVRHHEKIDGSGYPFALKGDDVSRETIVIAYSDIISALMENRPYRKGMLIDEAFVLFENKIAKTLDTGMFSLIKENKEDINDIVQDCRKESIDVYTRNSN